MTHQFKSTHSALLIGCICACAALLLLAGGVSAATYTVDNASDSATPADCTAAAGDCTLRGAIELANTDAAADQLEFDPSITALSIDSPLPDVTEQLLIKGAGVTLAGSALFTAACVPHEFAIRPIGARLTIESLPIFDVCGAAIGALQPPPTLQVGPRRADNTVALSGEAIGRVEIYRTDASVLAGEATETYLPGFDAAGPYARVPGVEPAAGERFTATLTTDFGGTSTFSSPAVTPWDLVSPTVVNAVGVSDNSVRVDFSEPISPAVAGHPEYFALTMGGLGREITNVGVIGSSVYLYTLTTPWSNGDAGSVAFTGNGRVGDATFGNELIGQPSIGVYAGPGELTAGTVTKARVSPAKFCQRKTRKCSKRDRTYAYFSLNKDSRVVFTVYSAKRRKFVLRYTRRLTRGQHKTRLLGTINGRRIPLGGMYLRIVAEDNARNFSEPVEVPFKTVNRNKQL